jgi:tetratricopeptide (TPR) repeat protein
VFVTNKKDKEVLLKLLLKFEQRVKTMEPFDPAWCDARVLEETAFALVAQGEAARANEEFAEAIRLFSEAKAKDPNMAAAWYGYAAAIGGRVDGAAYKGAGANAEEEMAGYRRALEIDPNHALAHWNLSTLLEAKGDVKGAIASTEKFIAAGGHPGVNGEQRLEKLKKQ